MPPGIKYDLAAVAPSSELCDVRSIYRLSGGFNLDDSALVAGSYLPPLAPLRIDFATRKAVAVKNVKVVQNAAANATSIRVVKESLAYVGMFIGDGTKSAQVTAIDKTNTAYDVLTVSLTVAVTANQILFETADANATTPKKTANFLNYARVKVETGATVSAIGSVFEIKESKMKTPVCPADKIGLTSRFMFI